MAAQFTATLHNQLNSVGEVVTQVYPGAVLEIFIWAGQSKTEQSLGRPTGVVYVGIMGMTRAVWVGQNEFNGLIARTASGRIGNVSELIWTSVSRVQVSNVQFRTAPISTRYCQCRRHVSCLAARRVSAEPSTPPPSATLSFLPPEPPGTPTTRKTLFTDAARRCQTC